MKMRLLYHVLDQASSIFAGSLGARSVSAGGRRSQGAGEGAEPAPGDPREAGVEEEEAEAAPGDPRGLRGVLDLRC